MRLYLMQHGAAVDADQDAQRSLSSLGIQQVKAAGVAIRRLDINFDLILCSEKKRAHQTAALIAETVNYPYSDILVAAAINPTATSGQIIDFLACQEKCESTLVVGHLPSLAELAKELLGASGEIHLENSGLCLLELTELGPGRGRLGFSLTNTHLRIISGCKKVLGP